MPTVTSNLLCVEFRKFLADYNTYYTNHAYYTDDSNDYNTVNTDDADNYNGYANYADHSDYGLFLKSISIVNTALLITILCVKFCEFLADYSDYTGQFLNSLVNNARSLMFKRVAIYRHRAQL